MKRFFIVVIFLMTCLYTGVFYKIGDFGVAMKDVKFNDIIPFAEKISEISEYYLDIQTLNFGGFIEDLKEDVSVFLEEHETSIEEKGFWVWLLDIIKFA